MLLNRREFLVKEHVALIKLTDTYDIIDPASGRTIGVAREEPPAWAKFGRLVVNKQFLPTTINVYDDEGSPPVLVLHKAPGLLRQKVTVTDDRGATLGRFESKLFALGGGFHVYDPAGSPMAEVKGDWKGWNFQFLSPEGEEIGLVTKKWAGIGKELFTTADTYMISLTDRAVLNPAAAALLLAAGLAIDTVLKEKK